MKKLLCVAICAISVIAAQAGSISGINLGAPVSGPNGQLGATAMGQFYIGADENSLAPFGSPANFLGGGLINAGVITATGTVALQLRAWEGASSFDTASVRGSSSVISVTASEAPAPPTSLSGQLTAFTITDQGVIPEPSTIALGLLGAAALFLRRRK